MLPLLVLLAATSSVAVSCRDGDDAACLVLERVATAGARGPETRALPELEAACLAEVEARACGEAAMRYRDSSDAAKARGLFRVACGAGYWTACNDLEVSGDRLGRKISARMFLRSCERGDTRACRDAADWLTLLDRDGAGSPEKTRPLYQRACDGGDGAACYSLALRSSTSDPKGSRKLLQRACKLGNPDACADLKTIR